MRQAKIQAQQNVGKPRPPPKVHALAQGPNVNQYGMVTAKSIVIPVKVSNKNLLQNKALANKSVPVPKQTSGLGRVFPK